LNAISYFVWAAWELVRLLMGQRKPLAFTEFARMWRAHLRALTSAALRTDASAEFVFGG
jgi:hypothetical protein